jgi:uncharacterized glyoxalase superfamily protein PhnB
MSSPDLTPIEIEAFVPAKDFQRSRQFYEALGFTCEFATADLAGMRFGATSFLLQDFFVRAHADNFMMYLVVENADAWHAHAAPVAATFQVRIDPPEDRPWGLRDFILSDPSGVLWRVSQRLSPPPAP